MRSVLYLHGFASSPASAKIEALRPLLLPHGIELNAPDLNVPSFERLDFGAMVAHAVLAADTAAPHAIVGSSLGSLVALAAARQLADLPLVLIAPALGAAPHWIDHIAGGDPVTVMNYARNEEATIHRAFFEQMAAFDGDHDAPLAPVTVIMGRSDETVPFEFVEATWQRWEATGGLADGSRFIAIDEGDHSLVAHASTIADAIVEAVRTAR